LCWEVPDGEVYEAAEKPEDLALEIAEVIAHEIFDFSSVSVVPQHRSGINREGLLPS
jgi:hypothetical protein